jgi:hypothetical protein
MILRPLSLLRHVLLLALPLAVPAVASADPCTAPLPPRGAVFSAPVRYVGDGDSLCVGPTAEGRWWNPGVRLHVRARPPTGERENIALSQEEAPSRWTVELNPGGRPGDANRLSAVGRDMAGRLWLLRQGWLHPHTAAEPHIKDEAFRTAIRILDPIRPVFRGGRTSIAFPSGQRRRTRSNPHLIRALKSAHAALASLGASPMIGGNMLQAAAAADFYTRRIIPLAFLAPDIQQAILEGQQPQGVTMQRLLDGGIPAAWEEQRSTFGFAA